jgi:hypothetical protein
MSVSAFSAQYRDSGLVGVVGSSRPGLLSAAVDDVSKQVGGWVLRGLLRRVLVSKWYSLLCTRLPEWVLFAFISAVLAGPERGAGKPLKMQMQAGGAVFYMPCT